MTHLTLRELEIEGYEKVVEVSEPVSGLHAIIAIHDTTLGPALGGIRVYPYATFDEALTDALRLSKGMTYKSAVIQGGTGGGKSVIIADRGPKSPELLLAFAEAINALKGKYIGAEDSGMTPVELSVMRQSTRFMVGLNHPESSGDPSPFTTWGGFRGIQAVCKKLYGTSSVSGRTFAVQGLGAVGMKLAEQLFWHGGKLIVTDVVPSNIQEAVHRFGAEVVSPEEILAVPCDILVPCALGGILNKDSIPDLQCRAVAGLANNQLLEEEDGQRILERGILYAPDFVINAGGLVNVCSEIEEEHYNAQKARAHVDRIFDTIYQILVDAEQQGVSSQQVAVQMAEENIRKKAGKRTAKPVFHH